MAFTIKFFTANKKDNSYSLQGLKTIAQGIPINPSQPMHFKKLY